MVRHKRRHKRAMQAVSALIHSLVRNVLLRLFKGKMKLEQDASFALVLYVMNARQTMYVAISPIVQILLFKSQMLLEIHVCPVKYKTA